ncbi:MAG: WbqC family protein [Dysgonamonadaceae bacterium]|jgi:hypothetical protein|nr:WbqC family protein [Dysgonamonadaceae bacterium]MEA5081763.1 WbqC family protein [Dysgonamonadaceae bacterium]
MNGDIILSSLYAAPIQYYSELHHAAHAVIEIHDNYEKQSYRNRCVIAGANGPLQLNIPIEKPSTSKCEMKDIRIAEHGNWRHLHWNAIISAYNTTPFFEFFTDDFYPFYEKKQAFLLDFNEELRRLFCRLMHIDTPVSHSESYITAVSENQIDFRESIHPKKDWQKIDTKFMSKPYYQVFEGKLGFLPNLSIFDLLFNMGNEARLYL